MSYVFVHFVNENKCDAPAFRNIKVVFNVFTRTTRHRFPVYTIAVRARHSTACHALFGVRLKPYNQLIAAQETAVAECGFRYDR